jgi:hypothetical protein
MAGTGCGPKNKEAMMTESHEWKPLDLGPQKLEMVFARLVPGTNNLVVRQGEDYLSTEEINLLRSRGIQGELIIRGMHRRGQGDKKARVLVVLETNVTASVELKQPDGTNAVYIQAGPMFVLLPENVPTITKSLKLEPYDHPMDGETTHYSIEMGSVIQGGTAVIWNSE